MLHVRAHKLRDRLLDAAVRHTNISFDNFTKEGVAPGVHVKIKPFFKSARSKIAQMRDEKRALTIAFQMPSNG